MAQARNQVIYAPSHETPRGVKSVFLAGTTGKVDTSDWRETLSSSLSDVPVTIYNPYRADWDSSWREDIEFAPYREQVEWELDKQDKADIVVVYFHPATQAPVSLLEFGIWARIPGKAIVVCPEGYWKRGNVQIVCKKFGVEMVDSVYGLTEAIVRRLPSGL
ncbi:nucleoside 2-deoxyribosyltransferase like domain-containing protein [Hirsutella rhossiliensis]|uniref:Nucleoside 2-deoxyribosyltransferase like domain-containing protein n=1 Tax=Hirsutella rhossiliensis TaxID=111463 RepID=A0A9P8MWH8_9HYPO|nr:nucleoside 2-deoxyribosyltransferase like domain-containing protein [Hirsutella rhossiliensis]KAH0962317.1 nucleoside 2-deoxyribosyltransferase like domain-containing protein [Hirsutella rhossiliensis]